MPYQHFTLLSTDGGYAAAIAALQSLTAAKVNFTPTQVIRDAAHDSNVKVVKANVTEAELDADGDLVDLRLTNGVHVPTALCRGRYVTLRQARKYVFPVLGEMVRSAFPTMLNVHYVGAKDAPAGNADGSTPFDAFDGYRDLNINGGADRTLQSGTRYVTLGLNYNVGSVATNVGPVSVEDCVGIDPIHIACDYAANPGMRTRSSLWSDGVTSLGWVQHSGAIYKKGDYHTVGVGTFHPALFLRDADPTVSLTDLWENHCVNVVTALSDLIAGTYYRDTNHATQQDFDAVLRNTSSVFTDETADAASPGGSDVIAFVDGAADGDYIAFGVDGPWTTGWLSTVAAHTGDSYTTVVEYWNGSSWATVPGFDWGSADQFKVWNFGQLFATWRWVFNDPNDWAQNTLNSQGPFNYIRVRKTGGTVSGDVLCSEAKYVNGNAYVWRPDGAAVTDANQPLHRFVWNSGFFWDSMSGKSNYVLDQDRTMHQLDALNAVLDKTVKGGQHVFGNHLYGGGGEIQSIVYEPSDDDPLFSILGRTDRDGVELDINHRWIQDDAITRLGMTAADYANLNRWPEIHAVENGPYSNNTGVVAWAMRAFVTHVGDEICNSRGTIIDNRGVGDHHSFASIGGQDNNPASWDIRLICLYVSNAWNIYQQATGSGDLPRDGTAADFRNFVTSGSIIAEYNAVPDVAQPNFGVSPTGDADIALYDDGSGLHDGNQFNKMIFANLDGVSDRTTVSYTAAAILANWDQEVEMNGAVFENLGLGIAAVGFRGGSGQASCSAVVVVDDPGGTPAYTHLSDLIKSSGNTASKLFPDPAVVGDYVAFMMGPRSMNRLVLNCTTAATGTFTLAFEEFIVSSGWVAVSNPDFTSSIFNSTGSKELRWDRPTSPDTLTIDGEGPFMAFRIRLATGSFTVVPEVDEARTYDVGGMVKARDVHFRKMPGLIVADSFNATQYYGGTSIDLDDFTGELLPGQTIAASAIFAWISNRILSAFQSQSKPTLTTDAQKDSVFLPSVSTTPGVDLVETPRDGSTVMLESTAWFDAKHSNNFTEAGRMSILCDRVFGGSNPEQLTDANMPHRRRSVGTYWMEYPGVDKSMVALAAAFPADLFEGGGTMVAIVRADSDGENNAGHLYEKGGDTVSFENESGGNVDLVFTFAFSGDDAIFSTSLTTGADHIVILRGDLDLADNSDFSIIVDGVTRTVGAGVTSVQEPTGTHSTNTASDLVLGDVAAGNRCMDGRVYHLGFTASEISDTDAGLVNTYFDSVGEFGFSLP